jgi:hypothetical protein
MIAVSVFGFVELYFANNSGSPRVKSRDETAPNATPPNPGFLNIKTVRETWPSIFTD